MTTTYEDFFVRSYGNDTNTYPKPASSSVWTSPDIIPWGGNVCEDPKTQFLGNNFNKDFGNEILPGIMNYLYVRGKNFAQSQVSSDLYLYWSTSTMLLSPNSWKRNAIKSTRDGKDHLALTVGAGQESVCDSDTTGIFAWKPEALDNNKHYCLISRVVSEKYPAPIPNLGNIDDFSVFLRSEEGMGYAQRNLRFKNASLPDDIIEEEVNNDLEEICDAYMIVNCYNLPVGSTIQMTCPGSTSKCYIEIPKSPITVQSDPDHPISFAAHIETMPALFKSPIYIYFWSEGKKVPSSYDIQLDFVWIPSTNAKSVKFAQPMNTADFQHLTLGPDQILTGKAALEAIGPRKGIRVGSCKSMYR